MSATIDQKVQMAHGLLAEAEELHQRALRIRNDRSRQAVPLPTNAAERSEEMRSRIDYSRAQDHQVAAIAQERAFLLAWADDLLVQASQAHPEELPKEPAELTAHHPLATHAPLCA